MAELNALYGYIETKVKIKNLSTIHFIQKKKLNDNVNNQIELIKKLDVYSLLDAFLSYSNLLCETTPSFKEYYTKNIDFNGNVLKFMQNDNHIMYYSNSKKFIVENKVIDLSFYIYKKKDNLPSKYREIWNQIQQEIFNIIFNTLDTYVMFYAESE